jgi:3-hydroxymyristoyl/3-hydroxydecanoyl-(acyl carrier protein) dehydratase
LSKIKNDIERYLVETTKTGSTLTSIFMFPPEFIGFQGHFPSKMVLPGACQIQCAISTIEKALEQRVILKEIVLAKYMAPIFPGDSVTCTVSRAADTGVDFIYKARFTKGTEKTTDLKLRVSLPGDAT